MSWWSKLWCAKDNLISGNILEIENHSEYNSRIQYKAKQNNLCGEYYWIAALALYISKAIFLFFCSTQNLVHSNDLIFPAMASTRRLAFVGLVRIPLQAHKRASGWSQGGSSHNSDSEQWQTSPYRHTSSNHLPRWRAATVGQWQLSPWLVQLVLVSRLTLFLHCLTASAPTASDWLGPDWQRLCHCDSAARGKMLHISISHKTVYVYIVRIYRVLQAIYTYDIVFHVRYRIIPTLLSHVAYGIVGKPTMSYTMT